MTRREVAAWLGCSDLTEEWALDHCHKQGLDRKETKEFMKAFAKGKVDWAEINR
mgnify:CR=1 FL=1